jgi:hypothetical protein
MEVWKSTTLVPCQEPCLDGDGIASFLPVAHPSLVLSNKVLGCSSSQRGLEIAHALLIPGLSAVP